MSEADKRPPVFGAYRDPSKKNPVIAESRPTPNTPAKALTEGLQEDMQKDIEQTKETTIKAKGYAEILEEAEISLDKARMIVDDLLTKGYYEEDIQITKSSYVTLRTRTHADYRRYLRALEAVNPKYIDEQQEIQIRYFLAASIVAFKGQAFSHPKPSAGDTAIEDAFDQRLEWITNQPDTLINLIAVKLSKFDRMVKVVMSEGVIENF